MSALTELVDTCVNMDASNVHHVIDLANACKVVDQIVSTKSMDSIDLDKALVAVRLVGRRLGDNPAWRLKYRTAHDLLWDALDRRAEGRARERQLEVERAARRAAEAEETRRKAKHAKNLRHLENQRARAERNRIAAKGSGCGTQKKQEGRKSKKR